MNHNLSVVTSIIKPSGCQTMTAQTPDELLNIIEQLRAHWNLWIESDIEESFGQLKGGYTPKRI